MKTEKEIKTSDNKKVVVNVYDNNVISYVTRSHEDGKAIFYTLHFNRKSDKEYIKIPAGLLSEIMAESGYKCSVRAFNTTNEDFNKFFSGANIKIIGVPFVKGTTKFLNPFNGNYLDGKPANNDGESLHIEVFTPTKEFVRQPLTTLQVYFKMESTSVDFFLFKMFFTIHLVISILLTIIILIIV